MAFEGHGTADIRGIQISKILKGFADEEFMFKSLVTNATTSAREIRWYKRESGVLDTTDSEGMTGSRIDEGAELALLETAEQKVERQTSRIKIFGLESPWISEEDFMDTDVQIVALNQKQVPRAVVKSVNDNIYDVMSESQSPSDLNTFATTAVGGDQWDAASFAAEIAMDVERAKTLIRENNYEPTHIFLYPRAYEFVVAWLYAKGAQAPTVGSSIVQGQQLVTLFGLRVVVSNSVVTDSVWVGNPAQVVTYWQFSPLSVQTIYDERMAAYKVVVRERGIATLTDPKAGTLITDINT